MSGVKNTVRLLVNPSKKDYIGLAYVVWDVLEDLAGVARSEIFCLQDCPKRGLYDITFHQEDRCHDFLECLRVNKGSPVLAHIKFLPLFGFRERPMIVHLFNPYADIRVVMTYLERYCDSVRGGVKQQNAYGIFNGKYKLWVRLKVEPACVAGVKHPPANFCIAGIYGFLVYHGQPSSRKTLSPSGHFPFEKICRCGGDHQECDFGGHPFIEHPRVWSEEDAMVEYEATMENGKNNLKENGVLAPNVGGDATSDVDA